MEAQRSLIEGYVASRGGVLIASFEEVMSGRDDSRGILENALAACKRHGATLVIAKIDRLARRLSFVARLLEGAVPVAVATMPNADIMTLQILAVVAEAEAKMISERTKHALAAAKQRGIKLGNPRLNEIAQHAAQAKALVADEFCRKHFSYVLSLRASGSSLTQIADRLNALGIPTANGGTWWPTTVANLLARGSRLERSLP